MRHYADRGNSSRLAVRTLQRYCRDANERLSRGLGYVVFPFSPYPDATDGLPAGLMIGRGNHRVTTMGWCGEMYPDDGTRDAQMNELQTILGLRPRPAPGQARRPAAPPPFRLREPWEIPGLVVDPDDG